MSLFREAVQEGRVKVSYVRDGTPTFHAGDTSVVDETADSRASEAEEDVFYIDDPNRLSFSELQSRSVNLLLNIVAHLTAGKNLQEISETLERRSAEISSGESRNLLFLKEIYAILAIIAKAERPTAPPILNDESKLDKARLAPIFEGQLDRNAMAQALAAVMKEQGLSVRKAAAAVDTSTNDIQRITNGTATLDKAREVLSGLGYELHVEVRKAEPS